MLLENVVGCLKSFGSSEVRVDGSGGELGHVDGKLKIWLGDVGWCSSILFTNWDVEFESSRCIKELVWSDFVARWLSASSFSNSATRFAKILNIFGLQPTSIDEERQTCWSFVDEWWWHFCPSGFHRGLQRWNADPVQFRAYWERDNSDWSDFALKLPISIKIFRADRTNLVYAWEYCRKIELCPDHCKQIGGFVTDPERITRCWWRREGRWMVLLCILRHWLERDSSLELIRWLFPSNNWRNETVRVRRWSRDEPIFWQN